MAHIGGLQSERFYFDEHAARYDRHRSPGGPHFSRLKELASRARAQRVLELGPGTGNSAKSFLDNHPCALTGIDRSRRMLDQAARKSLPAHWVNGDAHEMPYDSETFDMVYSVLVFQHLHNPERCISECYRVIRAGCLAIVTAPGTFIETHFLNRYFPSFSVIDGVRFQHEGLLETLMQDIGFNGVEKTYTRGEPVLVDEGYLEKVEHKFISTLELIPEDEFAEGLARLTADVHRNGQLDTPFAWESVVVSGWKS